LDYLILLDDRIRTDRRTITPVAESSGEEAGRSSAGIIVGTHPASL
jgi:hypothetical protein